MKILYLTWGERVSDSGLYKSQVLNLCAAMTRTNVNVQLCSYVPILNRDAVREKLQYFSLVKKCTSFVEKNGFKLSVKHYLGSSFESYTPWLMWPLIHAGWNLARLKTVIKEGQFDVIHCRSYHAAFAALKAMKSLGKYIPLVFDPRGLMPEEGVLHGRFARASLSYSRWKKVERYIIKKAAVTIAVSESMKVYYSQLGAKDVRLIYISSDMKTGRSGCKSIDAASAIKQLIYVGAIGAWHPAEAVFDVFFAFRKTNPGATLRILAPKNTWDYVRKVAAEKEINQSEFSLGYAATRLELESEIRGSYAGLLTYRAPSNEIEALVASTVLSTKFVEYLTGGIPVIVNKHCGGAAKYIFSHDCGVVYDPEHVEHTSFVPLDDFWNDSVKRVNVINRAVHDFSVENNAERYKSLYAELV